VACDAIKRDQLLKLFDRRLIDTITGGEMQEALILIGNRDGHRAKARRPAGRTRDAVWLQYR
jgi:hypothetical protein